MIEQVLERRNLNRAYQKVVSNKGAGGVDGLQVSDLKTHLHQNGTTLLSSVRSGGYQPGPIKGVTIPKPNGRTRQLGVPQGAPLSPLLSNILLNELDKELEKRGLRYVRYADDFSIYVRSKKAARRVGNGIFKYLRDRLHLPINREKSGIRRPLNLELLGYAFVSSYKKGERGNYQLVVSKKKWATLKASLKAITRKTIPMTFDERIQRLNWLIRGWTNYFKLASIQGKLKKLDEWLRNRLRYCIWHHWKRPERKRKNLIRLGVDPDHAYAWSRTRKGGWRIAQSPILGTTITVKRLKARGYMAMLEYYQQSRSS